MAVDWTTVGISVASSLVVSFIGVRYFTPFGIRAQHAEQARRDLRDRVAPLVQSARAYLTEKRPRREDGVTFPDDAVQAVFILKLSLEMSWIRQRAILRSCKRVFGSEWTKLAVEHADTVTGDGNEFASRALVYGIFTEPVQGSRIAGTGPPRVRFSDGLIQRAYVAGPRSREAKQLVTELERLQRGW